MKKIMIIDGGPRKYREEHWEEDLQKAFDAGRRMAEKIIK
jgi:hypothetical protein